MYDQQEKNKHKFMVQSVLAPPEADLTDLNKLVSSQAITLLITLSSNTLTISPSPCSGRN